MLISAVCPKCRSEYHLQEAMRGKPMRCTQALCRHVFLVGDNSTRESSAPERPSTRTPSQGSTPPSSHVSEVLELVPVEPERSDDLPLEKIDEPKTIPPVMDWNEPPPVRPSEKRPESRRKEPSPPREEKPAREAAPPASEKQSGPQVARWDSPPPVRRGGGSTSPPRHEIPGEPHVEYHEPSRPPTDSEMAHSDPGLRSDPGENLGPPRSRWAKFVIIPMVLFTLGALGWGGYKVVEGVRLSETNLARQANDDFDNGQFGSASNLYEQLLDRFPTSDEAETYRFRRELSDLRKRMAEAQGDIRETLDHAGEFLKQHGKHAGMSEQAPALGEALVKMVTDYAERSFADLQDEEPLQTEEHAKPILAAAKALKYPRDSEPPQWSRVDQGFDKIRKSLALKREREKLLDDLRGLATNPSYAEIVKVEELLREKAAIFPDLAGDAEVEKIRDSLYSGHLAGVKYLAGSASNGTPPPLIEEPPSLLFDPLVQFAKTANGRGDRRDGVVFGLARGVLHAMDAQSGQVRWAMRLGVDSTTLPLRLPAKAGSSERFLVLSSDSSSLFAVDVGGQILWRYYLGTPVLGKPVLVEERALLATYTGEVHEVETNEGKLLGRYILGQRLTLGGTPDPGSNRVYFPADDGCVYLLNTQEKRCEKILYTGHPAGSLRGEVLVLPSPGEDVPGFLVLNQATGLDRTTLRLFDLPVTQGKDHRAQEREVKPPATLRGWTWFDPYHDADKVMMLSDAGQLGLFGLPQPNNRDQPLFPLLVGGDQDLLGLLQPGQSRPSKPARRSRGSQRSRSAILRVEGDDFWVVAANQMQRFRVAWNPSKGPGLVPVWKQSLEVGSPLHPAVEVEESSGNSRLLVVGQPPGQSAIRASLVDEEAGTILWRRQLGFVAGGEPLAIPQPSGDPLWITVDENGGLIELDPSKFQARSGRSWYSDGQQKFLAEPEPGNLAEPPLRIQSPDGKSVYVVMTPGGGRELLIRQVVSAAEGERRLTVRERRMRLGQRLSGQPALVGQHLLFPQVDGALLRVSVPLKEEESTQEGGPNWRAERLGEEAVGHVLALGESRVLTTDGRNGLMSWEWPGNANVWKALPAGRGDGPTLQMK
ncbi:MAG: PQQ-binding-like beta-propeller repeat protein, partial [Gemmataceae bacterium]